MGEPSPLRNPQGTQGSACVEVMTILHGSTPSPWRRAEGCVPSKGTIASARDPLTHPIYPIEPPQPFRSEQRDMDSQIVTIDQFAIAMASIQEAIANFGQMIDGQQTQQTEVASSPVTLPIPTLEDPHTCTDRLEKRLRQMRASDGVITWEEFDGAPVASLPAKFRIPEIERYTGIGYPRIHLRLYSTVMRAHRLDEA
ncbi:hypothetical protein CK203_046868 [Vitis vinifera]|uniref:Uncharacterized protein n=1 Tax=Vitis vinifera TaxID=29760 RepID=A0A438HYA4_VITVI|nr:hypothetical protein CK203_046868 [Vitis vinifera]